MTYEDRLVTKRYLVTGRRKYRWHEPGSVFEATLDPETEARAIERGSIRVLTIVHPHLENDTYTLPKNWPHKVADSKATRANTGSRMN